ncbi:hypothetical protein ACFSJW_09000 [Flavobacterium artemisiae]|uniref:Uncharacterized protein n=1 Tax=Flavobacterium artemisiae TaxID=2126556 RepID=A0ABW4HEP5_9FLAO
MKKLFWILFCIYNAINIYSQNKIVHNIFMQKFSYSADNCFIDKKRNLVFFTKVYSAEELKSGLLDMNDSLTVKRISVSKNKYNYFLKETYEKDTIENNFKLNTAAINKIRDTKDLNKIVFKKIPSAKTIFDCNETKYTNVLLLKSFYLTHSLLSEDTASKKYTIKLIDENCNIALEEDYDRNLLFSENKSFLMFKNNDSLILIYDKYF